MSNLIRAARSLRARGMFDEILRGSSVLLLRSQASAVDDFISSDDARDGVEVAWMEIAFARSFAASSRRIRTMLTPHLFR